MWIILTACILAMCGSCNTAVQNNDPGTGDSVLLYKLDSMLTVGTEPCIINLQLQNKKAAYSHNSKTLLLFEHPNLIAAPDGVYEVYIGFQPGSTNSLSRGNNDFINLLDLYSYTALDAKDVLEMDISKQAERFFAQGTTPTVYISLLFKGNILPNGKVSSRGGNLRLSGIRIMQVKR